VSLEPATAVAALALRLDHQPVPPPQIVDGAPTTASAALGEIGDLEVGVWEMSVGAMSDVETDEVFVVIAGRATVRFDRDPILGETVPNETVPNETVLQLAPGSVARLAAGQRTVWTVTETLRKIYIA
jgi:uncharacterized cupin superfamily protein